MPIGDAWSGLLFLALWSVLCLLIILVGILLLRKHKCAAALLVLGASLVVWICGVQWGMERVLEK